MSAIQNKKIREHFKMMHYHFKVWSVIKITVNWEGLVNLYVLVSEPFSLKNQYRNLGTHNW